jgi:NAD(P)-dependent dehydrogenase (short-subunit alcohol dehydrogenase family)
MLQAAVEGFTRAAAAELAPRVRVNCIAPSLTDTALAAGLLPNDAARKALKAMHPMGRLGDASADLASAAMFLLDNAQSGWVTGQVLHVDGGRSTLK